MVISLDTNVVLRFLLDDVPEQTKKATQVIIRNEIYVTDVVIIEVIYVLEKVIGLSREDIKKLVNDFLGFSNIMYNSYFLLSSIIAYEKLPSLSIMDCYASEEAKAFNNKLVTFDRKLASRGGEHVEIL